MCDATCTQPSDFTRIPGAFRLQNGQAISLYPKLPSLLRVMPDSRSGLWATMTRKGQRNVDTMDYFLTSDQILDIPAGVHLVVEPWRAGHTSTCPLSDAYFDWRVVG